MGKVVKCQATWKIFPFPNFLEGSVHCTVSGSYIIQIMWRPAYIHLLWSRCNALSWKEGSIPLIILFFFERIFLLKDENNCMKVSKMNIPILFQNIRIFIGIRIKDFWLQSLTLSEQSLNWLLVESCSSRFFVGTSDFTELNFVHGSLEL